LEAVYTAGVGGRGVHEVLAVGGDADVAGERVHRGQRGQLAGELFETDGVEVAENEGRAGGCETARHGRADAPGRAAHDDRPAVNVVTHASPMHTLNGPSLCVAYSGRPELAIPAVRLTRPQSREPGYNRADAGARRAAEPQ